MIAKILAKIFGTQNERELRRLAPLVRRINELEPRIQALSDEELREMTNRFRARIQQGEHLDTILPEAFATAREAGKRSMGMRHFDVQLIGGIALHQGKIAEMKTGEGKTFVATLPLYLNGLSGKGAHLVTVNDYLARRDAEWMKPLYSFLGLEVGIIQNSMHDHERKVAYGADITYGTNNEFGFDYLRDNMKFNVEDMAQRELNFAIVDEVDSILIDEARTPLIISGPGAKESALYGIANQAISKLGKEDYEVDEKARAVHLTELGNDKLEAFFRVDNLYAPENILVLHHAQQALRAHVLFRRDVEYVVHENQVLIVDEFTGRILPGRRYSDGLHQAIEAKEGVKVERENQTLASITLQNYFRLYKKLAGMTGTAQTEAAEFWKIYKLGVLSIPTNRPMIREDEEDSIFLTKEDKYKAIIQDIKLSHSKGQPVLVGTISIENSELLSHLLRNEGIPHNVLNAKQHEREAQIVKEAGEQGRVTIATNMAGRGTDIKLGEGVFDVGGLRIVGTERHESRRIDNQLRGRAGRQGDPGSSKFYLSLDDDLMRIFGGEKLKKTLMRVGMEQGESIDHPMVTRSIEKAQERVEKQNFDMRKHLLEYDDVLNQQRLVVYSYRKQILDGADHIRELVKEMIGDAVGSLFAQHYPTGSCSVQPSHELAQALVKLTNMPIEIIIAPNNNGLVDLSQAAVHQKLQYLYEQQSQATSEKSAELRAEAEKWVLLESIDHAWRMHLINIEQLKEGIGLRGYGQKNPLIEYKKEAFDEFAHMMQQIKFNIASHIFRLKTEQVSEAELEQIERKHEAELDKLQFGGSASASGSTTSGEKTAQRVSNKVGRNEPCPCGSGKKYKACCGR